MGIRISIGSKKPDKDKAQKSISEVKITKKNELKNLFPNTKIFTERIFPLPKLYFVTYFGL